MTAKCEPWHVNCNCGESRERSGGSPPNDHPDANRYHQSLGAKWMVEAIIREYRTTFALNKHAREFANSLERRWEDEGFWRPKKEPGT